MNPRVLTAVSAWFSLLVPSQACGPFFPDTVLDKPQAALAAPPVSYFHNLCRLAGSRLPAVPAPGGYYREPTGTTLRGQVPLEVAELRTLWEKEGVASDVIAKRVSLYEEVRNQLLQPIVLPDGGMLMSFPTQGNQPPALAVRPLGTDFPQDVADYVEAARLHAIGNTAEARALWKTILDRPATERRLRAAWASWMLAKTSADSAECLSWYERVDTEIRAGATDAIGLGPAAKLWRAGQAMNSERMADLIAGMHLAYEAFSGGKEAAAIELRDLSGKIMSKGDADTLRLAAADPLVRRLINLDLHAALDGSGRSSVAPVSKDGADPAPKQWPWLTALQTLAPGDLDDGSRVAWALYSSGRYEESREWLALCPATDPLASWLQAKFDLRDGKLAEANKNLAEAIRLESQAAGWNPANPGDSGMRWFADSVDVDGLNQSRLLADSGIVSLALKDYLAALESLRKGGFEEDAAYLAESIISTDGLLRHVRKVVPEWVPVVTTRSDEQQWQDREPQTYEDMLEEGISIGRLGLDNELRYLLGRRLARERRFKEAREFMPPPLLPVFDHYVALDKARRSGRYTGKTLAAITWNQARMHRHLGAEFFGTQGAPDSGARYFSFSATPFHEIRTLRAGWKYDWSQDPAYVPGIAPDEKAIPEVNTDEVARMKKYSVKPMQRFHYRYTATDLAWQATRLLPPNHPDLARMYNTAGQWLSSRDPKAADRFYQAMVRRCSDTPEGKSADEKRWFLPHLAPLQELTYLPTSLQPPQTAANP
ncbi:MAG: hypothetical protein EOP88_21845 [Verrucomicrobiaceae bacterium]|nr:MAG: hypothetical protein EOP88_21845 [Verrucomicrobiaceae bacterium]